MTQDLLNINFNELLPSVIETFTAIYGEEYYDIISKRLNSTLIIGYQNYNILSAYLDDLYALKSRELIIKFLNIIGEDTSNYKSENYFERLDSKTLNLAKLYFSSNIPYKGFINFTEETIDNDIPIKRFEALVNTTPDEYVIDLINHLKENNLDEINTSNFLEFIKTDEYKEIYNKMCEYNKIFDSLLEELIEWSKQFEIYREIMREDEDNKKQIEEKTLASLIQKILGELPTYIRDILSNKSYSDIKDIMLGNCISYKIPSIIESFSKENMDILNNKNESMLLKSAIISNQIRYLKGIGINFDNLPTKYDSLESINKYLEFINQEEISKYIPYDIIDKITTLREIYYNEVNREYHLGRRDFIKIGNMLGNFNDTTYDFIYKNIKGNYVCVSSQVASNKENECIPILFYTIRPGEEGLLSHTFIHECGHAIDKTVNGCGFEQNEDFTINEQKNPYDDRYRKYERFNEAINDIYTMKANSYLWNKGIYLLESEEYTNKNRENKNTSLIVKELLYPLLDKYHHQVIMAKLNANHRELTDYIGIDNFEALVDVINKVDYLVNKGLVIALYSKTNNYEMTELVKEYERQVARLEKTYQNIDEYYNNYSSSMEK